MAVAVAEAEDAEDAEDAEEDIILDCGLREYVFMVLLCFNFKT